MINLQQSLSLLGRLEEALQNAETTVALQQKKLVDQEKEIIELKAKIKEPKKR